VKPMRADPTIYPSPAKTSFVPEEGVRDWALTQPFIRIRQQWMGLEEQFIPFLTKRLGKPTRSVTHEKHRWKVWEKDKYTYYAHPHGDSDMEFPEGVSSAEAAEALLWDLDLLDKFITREEFAKWYAVGVELATPHIVAFPEQSDDDLKKFVRDYCDGTIFTDQQLGGQDATMVFMPIMFGAFAVREPNEEEGIAETPEWLAMQKLPPSVDEPKHEDGPDMVEAPPYPPMIATPEYEVPDPQAEAQMRRTQACDADIEVQDVSDLFAEGADTEHVGIIQYREAIRLRNEATRANYDTAVAERLVLCDEINEENDREILKHKEAVRVWEQRETDFDKRLAEARATNAISQAAHKGFTCTRLQNIGVLYEYQSKAMPRSINGFPMFMSCCILTRAEWDRVRPAINRELDRRKNMEL
jgi:hypothetical protein